jgi:hypothetical protein
MLLWCVVFALGSWGVVLLIAHGLDKLMEGLWP